MIRKAEDLRNILRHIDRKGYKAYKSLAGEYSFGEFLLIVDHVQGDPFADPSRFVIRIPLDQTGVTTPMIGNRPRMTGMADYIARRLSDILKRVCKGNRGTGKSGLITISRGGQQVLEQTAVIFYGEEMEIRFRVGLPAAGRTILAREAEEMIFDEIPKMVSMGLRGRNIGPDAAMRHVLSVEDQDYLRGELKSMGLAAFLAEGSILPRRSGVDDRPLEKQAAVALTVPEDMAVTVDLPNRGRVKGLGIPLGVTLIVGGGFHGKSTLLNALVNGVYNHIPGDGRELAATLDSAVKIRAEDGRSVAGVNISPFISNLPQGRETEFFSTENASGSTSQAANIVEALEIGTELLLVDEDTSATNFMIRDERMQALVAKDKEPITPFVDKVRQLYRELGVSTVLVMGGSGDYFDVADNVIMMDEYHPRHVTEEARAVAELHETRRAAEGGGEFGRITARKPLASSFSARRGRREARIESRGPDRILYGETNIDISAVEQVVSECQTRAIGWIIHHYAGRYAGTGLSLLEGLRKVLEDIGREGFDTVTPYPRGDLAMPRIFEIAAAVNRMRPLRIEAENKNR